MKIDIIAYHDLMQPLDPAKHQHIIDALLNKGLIGVSHVPDFQTKSRAYVEAALAFSKLSDDIKSRYMPDRESGQTEGYELGAEWFKNDKGEWQIDDKKASFYAHVPDRAENIWPQEVDFKSAYLALGNLIYDTGKHLLNMLGLGDELGLTANKITGYGRMLHYHKENDATNANPDWCGAHLDHCLLTGLMPAYYLQHEKFVSEPKEAGLYIVPTGESEFIKIDADNNIMLFQIGEFGQIVSNDRVRATRHIVKKSKDGIERFAFALFINPTNDYVARSTSILTTDQRYRDHVKTDGTLLYGDWHQASFARYIRRDNVETSLVSDTD